MFSTGLSAAAVIVAAVAVMASPALAQTRTYGPRRVTLDNKIAHAHWRYRQAAKVLAERVNIRDGVMKRDEWEKLLKATNPSFAMTPRDLNVLRARHFVQQVKAAAKARRESPIKLDAIRGNPAKVKDFCARMPRAAILHVHPSGTRDLQTIKEMLVELNPLVNGSAIIEEANDGKLTTLYPSEVKALKALPLQRYEQFNAEGKRFIQELFFLPRRPENHPFTRFEALFRIGDILLEQDESKEVYVEEKTYVDFAKRAVRLGLSYVEFTKVVIPPTRKALNRFAELKALVRKETGGKMIANFVFAFVRTIEPPRSNRKWARELVALVKAKEEPSVRGIDLLANEENTPALEYAQGIYVPIGAAREAGQIRLKSTMHSGELGDVRNVRDAMIMGVERVGHGVLLRKDPVALEYARRNKVGIVCSLVSNKLLRVVNNYSSHPFLFFLRLGIPTSLSTDDEGQFRTDIANECEIAVTNTNIQYSEMVQLSRNAVFESFASPRTKVRLLATLQRELVAFEKSY